MAVLFCDISVGVAEDGLNVAKRHADMESQGAGCMPEAVKVNPLVELSFPGHLLESGGDSGRPDGIAVPIGEHETGDSDLGLAFSGLPPGTDSAMSSARSTRASTVEAKFSMLFDMSGLNWRRQFPRVQCSNHPHECQSLSMPSRLVVEEY